MKHLNLLFVLFLFSSESIYAQPPFQWATQMSTGAGGDDIATCIRTDAAGNTFACGIFKGTMDVDPSATVYNITSNGGTDIFVVKYSATGTLLWAFPLGGPYDEDEPQLAVDNAGDVYVTGAAAGDVDFDPSAANNILGYISASSFSGMFLAKYSSAGALLFAKRTTTIAGYGSNIPRALAIDNSNNLLVTGHFQVSCDFDMNATTLSLVSASSSNPTYFLVKYNSSGAIQWGHAFSGAAGSQGTAITVDAAGNAIVGAVFSGTGNFGGGSVTAVSSYDMALIKVNSTGTVQWTKRIGNATYNGQFNGLATDATGNIYSTGGFLYTTDFDPGAGTNNLTAVGSEDIFLAKYDATGNYVWAKSAGSYSNDRGAAICLDASSNIYLSGDCVDTLDADMDAGTAYVNTNPLLYYGIFMAKYDVNGTYINAKAISSSYSTYNRSNCIDASGNIRVAGNLSNFATADFDPGVGVFNLGTPGVYGYNFYAGSYTSSSFAFNWANSTQEDMTAYGYDNVASVATDAAGNTYVTGSFGGTMDVDPSATVNNLLCAGAYDMYIAKYAPGGNLVWAKSIGNTYSEYGTGVTVDAQGNVYVCGQFSSPDSVDFDPGAGVVKLKATELDGFILKLNSSGNFVWVKQITGVDYEMPEHIKLDASGNIYLAGTYNGTADFDPTASTSLQTSVSTYEDIFFAKYNSSGNILWSKSIGSTGIDYITGLAIDGSGNIDICGYESNALIDFDPSGNAVTPSSGIYNGFVAQYDAGGNYLWVKLFYDASFVSQAYGLDVDGADNIYVVGKFERPTTSFGGVNGGGTTFNEKIYIAKLNSSGTGQWVTPIGDVAGRKSASAIDADAAGNLYVGGYYFSAVNFGAATLTPLANQDCFFGKWNSSGVNQWIYSTAGSSNETVTAIAADATGNLTVGGDFFGTCDFNPTAGVASLTSKGNGDGYIFRMGVCPTPPAPANTTANSTICNGSSANLSATGSGTIGWYSALAGGNYLGGGNNFTTAALNNNTIFYAQDSTCGGASPRTAVSVTVSSALNVTANTTLAAVCAGASVTLSGGGATTYTWNNGVSNGVAFVPASTLTYTVTGTTSGCSATATVSVTVNSIPAVGASATASTVCAGEQTTLNGSGANTYTWSDGVTDNTAFTPASTLTYTVTGTTSGCTATATVSVTVNALPDVEATATDTTLCPGESTTLSGAGADSYVWSEGVTDNVAFTPSSTLTYTVTGTTSGCTATADVLVTVNTVDSVSISYAGDTICVGETATLVAVGAVNYLWSTSDITGSVSVSPMATTMYSVTANDANNCTSADTKEVAVHEAVDVSTTVNGFTITAVAANAGYQWRNCTTNTDIASANSQSYTATANGDYEVVVTAASGCAGTSACVSIVGVGFTEVSANRISVVPNPFTDQVLINGTEAGKEIFVFDAMGHQVAVKTSSATETRLVMDSLASGIYMLTYRNGDKSTNFKLVKF